MLRLTKEQQRAASSLKTTPAFNVVKDLLEAELQISIEGLMKADRDVVEKHQGRTQLLDELVKLFK